MRESIKERIVSLWDTTLDAAGWRIVPDPLPHPDDEGICTLDVPGYKQIQSYTCGFVAGAMVLHTFHPHRSLRKFFERCNPSHANGLEIQPLIRSLRSSGVGVSERHHLGFPEIVRTIDEGFPIITLVKAKLLGEKMQHWVVIYGYGLSPNRVFIAGDGPPVVGTLMGRKELLWSEFRSRKWDPRGFGLVCWGK
jgi:hypothetical protein